MHTVQTKKERNNDFQTRHIYEVSCNLYKRHVLFQIYLFIYLFIHSQKVSTSVKLPPKFEGFPSHRVVSNEYQ